MFYCSTPLSANPAAPPGSRTAAGDRAKWRLETGKNGDFTGKDGDVIRLTLW